MRIRSWHLALLGAANYVVYAFPFYEDIYLRCFDAEGEAGCAADVHTIILYIFLSTVTISVFTPAMLFAVKKGANRSGLSVFWVMLVLSCFPFIGPWWFLFLPYSASCIFMAMLVGYLIAIMSVRKLHYAAALLSVVTGDLMIYYFFNFFVGDPVWLNIAAWFLSALLLIIAGLYFLIREDKRRFIP